MRSSAARLEQTGSSVGIVIAVLLHVVVIAATLFTLQQHTLDIADQANLVPVDLVTVAAKTNVTASVKQKIEAPPKEDPVPVPTPEPAPPTPPAPQEQSAPPDESAEPAPQKPIPKVEPKNKPAQEPKKSEKFDINNIMAMLDKHAPASSAPASAKVGSRDVKGIGDRSAMTADLKDMLASQIRSCWTPPDGVPNAANLTVSFELFLNPDGSVAQPPHLQAESTGQYARAATEAARRAIYTCAPYHLPQDRYEQWRDVVFNFNPAATVGQ